ncbi:UDP-glucose--hexose-1-phosphate uridylyltransferase [Polymorphobacter arshaanensis]|uniref:Galactose-1-phosphate uridylyltransferase n=1 Tax=Glacieibacterium arshaanense TaxID=2511025 RepID=A0A4Y9EQT4_9SPHN|nr:UDP-glucose--hexose-1-phosphate uridylyltransferase [Polymorphobacter arshaanensis]TFU05965.1 UDP-glucose--hexose-1-phosphate uridylyltransferase [Polymorphobacter arshaanensis]
MTARPERRLNLLSGDWVLVSPQRVSRPWQGATEDDAAPPPPSYDPECYLCPGNARVGGVHNPDYAGVNVFDNDFPALLPGVVRATPADPLLVAEPEAGVCRVICYGPDHGRTMAAMTPAEIAAVVEVWAAQTAELAARDDVGAVTIFENRGAMMGASNPHPHGQIWATQHLPNELDHEVRRQRDWAATHGSLLLDDYLARELAEGVRLVTANDSFVALVPFWAAWPFELLVLPRRAVASFDALTPAERDGLAALLSVVTRAYDRLFDCAFPYSLGWHQHPGDKDFTLHGHFLPPLLRSATVRKHMVGFELLGMPQRDLTPEDAAARLRACL